MTEPRKKKSGERKKAAADDFVVGEGTLKLPNARAPYRQDELPGLKKAQGGAKKPERPEDISRTAQLRRPTAEDLASFAKELEKEGVDKKPKR